MVMDSLRHLFGAFIGVVVLCTSAQAQSTTLAIRGTWIVDVTDGSLYPDQTVLLRGNRVAAIGPATAIAIPQGAEIVEAAGGYLIPGLWDMHVHAARAGRAPRFWPLFAAHGVTGVRETGSFVDSLLHWRAESRRPASSAPRIQWSVPALGRWADAHALPEPDAEATMALVDAWKRHEFDFIKVGSELSRETYFVVMERARQNGIPVIGHIPRAVTATEASDAGQKSFEHVTELLIPCTAGARALGIALADAAARYGAASDSARAAEQRLAGALAFGAPDPAECGPLLERMIANETWLTPTLTLFKGETQPSSFDGDPRLRWVPAPIAERWRTGRRLTPELEARVGGRIMDNALTTVALAHRAGVGILAGTDAGDDAYIFAGSSLHDELALLVEAGLTPLEALQAATLNPARFLGRTTDLGTVTAGKLADLVLLEANPLEDIASTRRIRAVIADGRLYRAADLERLIADVERGAAAAIPAPAQTIGSSQAQEKPVVAMIGTGNLGGMLGPVLAGLGYPLIYGSREPERESVRALVARSGTNATAALPRAAAARAEIVILAVPSEVLDDVAGGLGDLTGKIVIDVSGGSKRVADDGYLELVSDSTNAERLQSRHPTARVVRIMIPTIVYFVDPLLAGTPPTVPIAGHDPRARAAVARMMFDIGLDPWDAGPLRFSRVFNAMGLMSMVPAQQGHTVGYEFRLLPSVPLSCFLNVAELFGFGRPYDLDDVAQFPRRQPPVPCSEWHRRLEGILQR
jgi:8-hydroxy-5-deazaflavin:NADPH oxidoreductase